MSNWQVIWSILCERAGRRDGPFEIAEVIPEVARQLGVSPPEASREVGFLLTELGCLPDGRQFFRREGNAVVALPEFLDLPADPVAWHNAYPFEL